MAASSKNYAGGRSNDMQQIRGTSSSGHTNWGAAVPFSPTIGASSTTRDQWLSSDLGSPTSRAIAWIDYGTIELPPTFKRRPRPRQFFKPGRVFWAWHFETAGPRKPDRFPEQSASGNAMQRALPQKRAFLVVEDNDKHCICVYITSYDKQGVAKRGVIKSDHAMIYTGTVRPEPTDEELELVNGELPMPKEPIRIIPDVKDSGDHELRNLSRVNFGKLITVDHYWAVQSLGLADKKTIRLIDEYYCSVRQAKQIRESTIPIVHVVPGTTTSIHSQHVNEPSPSPRDLPRFEHVPISPWMSLYKELRGLPEDYEPDSSTFITREPSWFKKFKVFQLTNFEEKHIGYLSDEETGTTEAVADISATGAPTLIAPRWFVVVEEGETHCICLRILTYQGQGLAQLPKTRKVSDHSVIYTTKLVPDLEPGEILGTGDQPRTAIRVKRNDRAQMMDPLARLLWSRPYKIMTNVRAYGFGKIHRESRDAFNMQLCNLGKHLLDQTPEVQNNKSSPEYADVGPKMVPIDRQPRLDTTLVTSHIKIPRPMFDTRDPVILLINNPIGVSTPRFRTCRIGSSFFDHSQQTWRYSLQYDLHQGMYLHGEFFNEAVLMRRFMS